MNADQLGLVVAILCVRFIEVALARAKPLGFSERPAQAKEKNRRKQRPKKSKDSGSERYRNQASRSLGLASLARPTKTHVFAAWKGKIIVVYCMERDHEKMVRIRSHLPVCCVWMAWISLAPVH